jgi:F0F1-type ATP synthase assembly protein I
MIRRHEVSLENSSSAWWLPAVALFMRLSVWIVGPVVAGAFLGKYLDRKMNTEPIMLIAIVSVSFIVSITGLVKESVREFKRIEEEEKQKKSEEEKELLGK